MAVIGVDFNGTCVTYDYPHSVGKDIGAVPVLKRLIDAGHEIVLITCISPKGSSIKAKPELYTDMLDWFADNGIPIIGVNVNPHQDRKEFPPHSGKTRCDLYIDDHSLGIPLKYDATLSERPFVNWKSVELLLEMHGYLPLNKIFLTIKNCKSK